MHLSESLTRVTGSLVYLAVLLASASSPAVPSACAQSELLPGSPAPAVLAPERISPTETRSVDSALLADKVLEIRILGNDTIATSEIDHHISTRVGRPFDRRIVQQDVRRLANLGWFVDVKPLYESTPQGRIVIFRVFERPTIRYVTYLGNEKIKDKNLAKQTNLKAGGAVDPYAVEEGRRKLIEYYQGRGYNNVQVTIMEGTESTDKGITYLINEGHSQKVWDVDFMGNEFVSSGRLKTIIKSKPPKFLFLKGYLNREEVDADVDRLTSYYRSFGFFQARVSRKIDYYSDKKWIHLTYVIHEGPRYKIRHVRFMGNTLFEPTALAETAKLKTGQEFEQSKIREDQRWIQELYGSHGYVFTDIRPETVFLEEPGEIDLVYHIDEGEQFRIGNVFVNIGGDNPHTRIQTMINRLSIHPGDIADIREINSSRRRIQQSNLLHVDAAAGVRPEITFKISEEGSEYEMTNRPRSPSRRTPSSSSAGSGSRGMGGRPRGMGGIRGQSPDDLGPLVLPPPSRKKTLPQQPVSKKQSPQASAVPVIRGQSPGIRAPRIQAPGIQSPNTATTQPAWVDRFRRHRSTQTARKPAGPYGNIRQNIRGQSPSGATQNAYAALPSGGQTQQNGGQSYGGQLVGATGPVSKPLFTRANTQPLFTRGHVQPIASSTLQQATLQQAPIQQAPIQQAQYSENLPPPAGSFGPTPGLSANAVPGYQIFPDGRFGLPGQPYPQQTVDIFVNGQETQTGRLMFGVGVNSDAGLVGNIVLDERNFDWRRWPSNGFEDFRNGTAFRGDGQRFRIDASPGSEVNRYLVSFTEPYLMDSPISLSLSGSFFDRRFRDWDEERVGGRIGVGHGWVERDLSAILSYRGENITISDAPNAGSVADLGEALGSNQLHGFKISLTNDTRDNSFLPTQGRYLEMSGEYVTGTFDYPRLMMDYRRFFLLRERPDHSGRHVLSFSTNVAWQGEEAPIYEHYFAGGHSTMRGFDFRGASPVDVATGVEVGGEFQWLNSLQYLFPITADEMLHGVVFCDFGTVETSTKIKDFRIVPGVGLRVAVPALGPAPIALDFGWAIEHADTDDRQVFSFSMGFGRN